MKNHQDPMDDLPFSNDPEENQRIENDFLALKMHAESNAIIHRTSNMDPALEHEYLKKIQTYELARAKAVPKTIYDIIGRPSFIPVDELSDDDIPPELEKLNELLAKHNFVVETIGSYTPETIYRFITERLFEELADGIEISGMVIHFVYEEFLSVEERTIRFITNDFMWHWSAQTLSENTMPIAPEIILVGASPIPRENALTRLRYFFEAYPRFLNFCFNIEQVRFEGEDGIGIGYAEGTVEYEAEAENGEITPMKATYTLYTSNKTGPWEIFHFKMPGFSW